MLGQWLWLKAEKGRCHVGAMAVVEGWGKRKVDMLKKGERANVYLA